MLESDRTLRYLERAVRARPIVRALVCPHCGSHEGGKPKVKLYSCGGCGWEYEKLAELRAVDG